MSCARVSWAWHICTANTLYIRISNLPIFWYVRTFLFHDAKLLGSNAKVRKRKTKHYNFFAYTENCLSPYYHYAIPNPIYSINIIRKRDLFMFQFNANLLVKLSDFGTARIKTRLDGSTLQVSQALESPTANKYYNFLFCT